jgi:hypothetical protein
MNELAVVDKSADCGGRRPWSSIPSPLRSRNGFTTLALMSFSPRTPSEPRPGFTRATVAARHWRAEERGSIRLAGTFCLDVAEAAEIEHSRGPTSGPSRKHRTCGYTPSHGIFTRNRHWSGDHHSRGPADSACETGNSRPVMDGIARRFGLGASEHRDEVSGESITACHLLSDGGLRVSGPPSRGVFDKETRTKPLARKPIWSDLKVNREKPRICALCLGRL